MTLGRGGSDYSASLYASYLDADKVVLYKEVNGLMTHLILDLFQMLELFQNFTMGSYRTSLLWG